MFVRVIAGSAISHIKQDTVKVQFRLIQGIGYKFWYVIEKFEKKILKRWIHPLYPTRQAKGFVCLFGVFFLGQAKVIILG